MKKVEIKYVQNQLREYNVSELDIIYKIRQKQEISINNSYHAKEVFLKNWNNKLNVIETFMLMLLNRANKIIGILPVSQGNMNGTVCDPKFILAFALISGASSIITCHNHPSGNTQPSENDIKISKLIKEGCKSIRINYLDNIIITPDGSYYSFQDNSIL